MMVFTRCVVPLAALAIPIFLSSACCPWHCPEGCETEPQCDETAPTQENCTFLPLQCRDETHPINQRNMNRRVIAYGDSYVAGYNCLEQEGVEKCGFVRRLEALLATEIANFGVATLRAEEEVTGDWSRRMTLHAPPGECRVTGCGTPFSRVIQSVEKNPGATRAYVHIGGNDILMDAFLHLPSLPKPPRCRLTLPVLRFIDEIVSDVRQIVEVYQALGVAEVVVGSLAPVEGDSRRWCCRVGQFCGRCHLCVNTMLEAFSFGLADMVESLGGADSGVYFADHFHGIVLQDPDGCELHCDFIHLNCNGLDQIAETWYQALPTRPIGSTLLPPAAAPG